MSCGAETTGASLYSTLMEEESGTVPDLTVLDNAALTTVSIDGSGTFDVLMRAFELHLEREYTAGRITGDEYTKAYVALTTAAMSNAVQFLMGKDNAYWNNMLLKKQVDSESGRLAQLKLQLAVLDEQYCLVKEQVEAKRAETMDTRVDGVTPISGSIGKQKELYTQQIDSYQKDATYKVSKLYSDAWIAQKTLDEGLLAPNEYTNAEVDQVLAHARNNVGIPT
jgi:hypothetical protein